MMSLNVFRYPDLRYRYSMPQMPHKSPVGNVRFSVHNGMLHFSADLSAELAVTKSGKLMIATTGPRAIFVTSAPQRVKLMLYVFRPIGQNQESEQLEFGN
jgi:hypothetical protein